MLRGPRRGGPLQEIERYQQHFNSAPTPALPIFHGGLVGYFGYITVRYTESKLTHSCPPDELDLPDILLVLAEGVLIFDGLGGTLSSVVNADATSDNAYEAAFARLDEIEATLNLARSTLTHQWKILMPVPFATELRNPNTRLG